MNLITDAANALQKLWSLGRPLEGDSTPTGSGIMTSPMTERVAPTRHKPGSRLLSRLRCGLQTRLSCTAGLSCKPSSSTSSESSSKLTGLRRRVDSEETVSVRDRKRLRPRDRKSSSDDVVGGSSDAPPDSAGRATSGGLSASGHATSASGFPGSTCSRATTCSTHYDVIGDRRHKRRCTRLATVGELDVPEPEMEMTTWSMGRATGNDVVTPLETTRHRRRAAETRGLRHPCCRRFCGKRTLYIFRPHRMHWVHRCVLLR